ncbi:uncharacterized protein LOC110449065 [Mizuhopecten yessoensis]|uniref:Uncharacterized protein n=1 Tax=Mizuhopecten yessoensis TaxID=6573 RepID=A0A210QRZ5_MIZYE|nr:uncharacterized protein LOC110449065 [Mizuhopecten yessoensis]OWF51506.1 hypothetical protein KP79_PYT21847 [Mizuhopecten yessoensis]
MYGCVRLSICVVFLSCVYSIDINYPRETELQTEAQQLWGNPSKYIPKLWADFRRTPDRSSVHERDILFPKPLTSWLHFPDTRPGSVDDGQRYFDTTMETDIGSGKQDVRINDPDEGISPGIADDVVDRLGIKEPHLDHSSDRHKNANTEINSLGVSQRDINIALDSWHVNEPETELSNFARPALLKRGYNDISPQYDGSTSMRFRSWGRDAEFRLNRFRPSSSRRRLRRPTVSVTVDGTTLDPDVHFTQNITPEPDMSVFRALMSAALTFRRHRAGAENPFNVMLDWDYENECEAIVDIFGMSNSDDHLWRIHVRRRRGQVVYRGVCFPPERVLVRPGTRVIIQYS